MQSGRLAPLRNVRPASLPPAWFLIHNPTVSGMCHQGWPHHTPLHISRIFQMASQVRWSPSLEFTCRSSSLGPFVKSLRQGPGLPPGQRHLPSVGPEPLLTCCGAFVSLTLSHLAGPLPSREKLRVGGLQLLCSGPKGEAGTGVTAGLYLSSASSFGPAIFWSSGRGDSLPRGSKPGREAGACLLCQAQCSHVLVYMSSARRDHFLYKAPFYWDQPRRFPPPHGNTGAPG